jgi:hypothetical protein
VVVDHFGRLLGNRESKVTGAGADPSATVFSPSGRKFAMTFCGFCHSARAGFSKRATSSSKSAWCMYWFAALSCAAAAGSV